MNVFDGMTQAEIATKLGVGHATVERRIANEKALFAENQERHRLMNICERRGLRITGDETVAELEEAIRHLNGSGR